MSYFLGLATISNMGAEVGATTSTFPYTPNMRAYLHATGRGPCARAADRAAANGFLAADEGAEYDEVIDIVNLHLRRRTYSLQLPRIFPKWNLRSTDRSHLTWPLLFPNSPLSLKRTGGATNYPPVSSAPVRIALMKTW